MQLDEDTCYVALVSRDRRFEGRFFVGVRTTGIYCRPGCPAPLPKRRNVAFYPSPSAAEAAGLRPCLRCRPDTSPGSPAAQGTPTTVTRALRLIGEGAMHDAGVEALAERVGIGGRHLRRLFDEHLGASPVMIAQTQRVHFARSLLEQTELSMTQVALASGFGSLRRFNDAVKRTYQRSPSDLRRIRRRAIGTSLAGAVALRLTYRPPLDWDALLAFLATRAIPGVEHVENGVYARTFAIGTCTGTWEARHAPDDGAVLLTVRSRGPLDLFALVQRVRRVFDLDADPHAIAAQLGGDPLFAPTLLASPGLRVPGAWDPFELTVRAILGQQITVRAATTLAGRLALTFGQVHEDDRGGGRLTRRFPTADELARADVTPIGLPSRRAATIAALAIWAQQHDLVSVVGAGVDETVARLTEIPGIGPWTAQYVSMRAGRDPDAFPASDLVLRQAAVTDGRIPTARELEARAEAWRPWRSYAALHLWALASLAAGKSKAAPKTPRRSRRDD